MHGSHHLHLLYEKQLAAFHPYGVPLYKPASTRLMRPGSVGYFNSLGEWAPITQLDDPKSLKSGGLKQPEEELERAEFKPITSWDRKYSEKVEEKSVTGKAQVDIPNLPAGGAVVFEYKSSANFGAVLITSNPVHRDAFYHESPFKRWVKDNVDTLMHHPRREEIKEHGLCIVTDVYSTKKCSLTAWEGSEKVVQVGFKVTAEGVLDVGLSGGWYVHQTAGAWNHYSGENATDEEVVVFASGFKFHFREILGFVTVTTHSLNSSSRLAGDPEDEVIDDQTGQKIITVQSAKDTEVGYQLLLEAFGLPGHDGELEEESSNDEDDLVE